ncbi:MAG: non-hydrolyzing UDP-N-acetylglucosamine 2-epimerase [Sphingosinicella sp.]
MPRTVHLIAAARPNLMKVAPLWHALAVSDDFEPLLVHTGQHYDDNMSGDFFADLGLPGPDFHLGIGSGSHAEQTGRVMLAYGELLEVQQRPDWAVVVGDVNSTLACALTAVKLGVRTVHLEAGLRSGDRSMPEEINRIATDAVADVLWTPSPDADANLAAERIPAERITRVGNIMIDSFEMKRGAIEAARVPDTLSELNGHGYCVATLHRPANVDDPKQLMALAEGLAEIQQQLPVIFPVHPRTAAKLNGHKAGLRLKQAGVQMIEPMSYVRFMSLVCGARAVVTDSGGIQEETTYLGIPCFTLRDTTERPVTIWQGTNRLARPDNVAGLLREALNAGNGHRPKPPEYWDGQTATRCVEDLRWRSYTPRALASRRRLRQAV